MEYIFEHNKSIPIVSLNNEDNVTPSDLLHCDLIFPTCRDIIQYNPMMVKVGVHEAIISRKELWDDSKATLKYFSTIIGSKSTKKISAEERHAGLAISAIDSVGETLHGASTNLLYKLAQIQLGIEGARICTRDGYIPARICTRYG